MRWTVMVDSQTGGGNVINVKTLRIFGNCLEGGNKLA
jgi:hypothetical protein